MHKLGLAALTLLLAAPYAQQPAATHVAAAQVEATIDAAPEGRVSDQQIRMVSAGDHNVGVGVVQRPPTTTLSAIQHHRLTEIYRVVSGGGTLVTGGVLAGGQELDPNGATVRQLAGPSATGTIEGGTSRRIGPGDVVIIPPGVAHGFSEITETITYLVFRMDPDQVIELKQE